MYQRTFGLGCLLLAESTQLYTIAQNFDTIPQRIPVSTEAEQKVFSTL